MTSALACDSHPPPLARTAGAQGCLRSGRRCRGHLTRIVPRSRKLLFLLLHKMKAMFTSRHKGKRATEEGKFWYLSLCVFVQSTAFFVYIYRIECQHSVRVIGRMRIFQRIRIINLFNKIDATASLVFGAKRSSTFKHCYQCRIHTGA